MGKNWLRLIEKNEGVILLLLLVIGLRIPSLLEPYWYGDEGIYLVLGQALRKGLVFYRDIHDNKPPLLYLLSAIAGNVFWFRMMLMVWFGTAVVLFLKLTRIMWPKNKALSYGLTLGMIGLTTIFEGNVANAEIFIILPVIGAMLLASQGKNWFMAGLLFSAGFLLKVPAAFDLAALVLWLIWQGRVDKKLGRLILGFFLPIAGTIGYYGIVGGGERYIRSALFQNIGYLSSWGTSNSGLVTRLGVIAATLGIIFWISRRTRFSQWANLSLIWLLMAMFGALLSGRPYPHYLIQPAVPAILVLGWIIKGQGVWIKATLIGVVMLCGYWYWQIRFWSYPLGSYYVNFGEYILRQKSLTDYRNYFDPRVSQTYNLAEYITETTGPDERIFIWGDEPGVYALAERLPTGRYAVAYHIVDFNGYEETMAAWEKQPPKVVLTLDYEQRPFKQLETRLATDYVFAGKIDQANIYRRLENR